MAQNVNVGQSRDSNASPLVDRDDRGNSGRRQTVNPGSGMVSSINQKDEDNNNSSSIVLEGSISSGSYSAPTGTQQSRGVAPNPSRRNKKGVKPPRGRHMENSDRKWVSPDVQQAKQAPPRPRKVPSVSNSYLQDQIKDLVAQADGAKDAAREIKKDLDETQLNLATEAIRAADLAGKLNVIEQQTAQSIKDRIKGFDWLVREADSCISGRKFRTLIAAAVRVIGAILFIIILWHTVVKKSKYEACVSLNVFDALVQYGKKPECDISVYMNGGFNIFLKSQAALLSLIAVWYVLTWLFLIIWRWDDQDTLRVKFKEWLPDADQNHPDLRPDMNAQVDLKHNRPMYMVCTATSSELKMAWFPQVTSDTRDFICSAELFTQLVAAKSSCIEPDPVNFMQKTRRMAQTYMATNSNRYMVFSNPDDIANNTVELAGYWYSAYWLAAGREVFRPFPGLENYYCPTGTVTARSALQKFRRSSLMSVLVVTALYILLPTDFLCWYHWAVTWMVLLCLIRTLITP